MQRRKHSRPTSRTSSPKEQASSTSRQPSTSKGLGHKSSAAPKVSSLREQAASAPAPSALRGRNVVLGVDTGKRCVGFALLRLPRKRSELPRLLEAEVGRKQPDENLFAIAERLLMVLAGYRSRTKLVALEEPAHPRLNVKVFRDHVWLNAILEWKLREAGWTVVLINPLQAKTAVRIPWKERGSKAAMIAAVKKQVRWSDGKKIRSFGFRAKKDEEACADAVAVAIAGWIMRPAAGPTA